MADEYSIELCNKLQQQFHDLNLHRPMRIGRYNPGTELTYEVQEVLSSAPAKVKLIIESFIGGGFAGQVYKVKVQAVENLTSLIEPFMLVFLGVTIGGLVVAMYLPIFKMAGAI